MKNAFFEIQFENKDLHIIECYCPLLFCRVYVLGALKNHLIEMVLLSTHNICYGLVEKIEE